MSVCILPWPCTLSTHVILPRTCHRVMMSPCDDVIITFSFKERVRLDYHDVIRRLGDLNGMAPDGKTVCLTRLLLRSATVA